MNFADRLGLELGVCRALGQSFERWDGKGFPGHCAGERIDPVMRIIHIADIAEVFLRMGGLDVAVEMVRSRRGTELDPTLVDLFCTRAPELVAGLDDIDIWEATTTGDGSLGPELTEAELTQVLRAFADLKSPSWLGHSAGVAALATDAARRLGLPATEVTLVERAGLVHDLGVIGVSTRVWDKPGPLSPAELERVRTHPYLTERVLARPARLAEIGAVSGLHHERVDGRPRGRGCRCVRSPPPGPTSPRWNGR